MPYPQPVQARRIPPWGWLTAILLVSAGLRIHALGQDVRFHPDEALYATFARDAVVYGDWMLPGPLDKPPLSLYAAAVSIHFLGAYTAEDVYWVTSRQGEFAARFPNVMASILLTALTYALARALYRSPCARPWRRGESVPLGAAFLVAVSPYVIVFSATAFTDMLMVTGAVAALLLATRGRPGWSGAFLALSVAAKPQGIFFLPLVVGILFLGKMPPANPLPAAGEYLSRRGSIRGRSSLGRSLAWFGLILGAGIGLLGYWDAARAGPSVFALARDHYPVERLVMPLRTWPSRLAEWLDYGGWLLGPPVVTGVLVAVALGGGIMGRRRGWQKGRFAINRKMDGLLWAFIGGYAGLHWVMGVSVYDRYLLPLAPLLALVCARGSVRAGRAMAHRGGPLRWLQTVSVIGVLVLGVTAYAASGWRLDLGRDHYPLDRAGEIIQLADYLQAKPVATIIYDPWLGWEMGYYLGVWSNKRHVHYPDPETLVADALRVPEIAPRYLIAPTDAPGAAWVNALAEAGFGVTEDFRAGRYVSYRLLPPPSLAEGA